MTKHRDPDNPPLTKRDLARLRPAAEVAPEIVKAAKRGRPRLAAEVVPEIVEAAARKKITAQAVGAFGEKAVESELLRHGWIPSNVNATVKNAADFDIYALKGKRTVHLRVKTCGPDQNAFQFGFKPGEDIPVDGLRESDFTILVRMGSGRADDVFYILPTKIIREQLRLYRREFLAQARRDGFPRQDLGHWTLRLYDLKSGEERHSYGLARKWVAYKNNWTLLEHPTSLASAESDMRRGIES